MSDDIPYKEANRMLGHYFFVWPLECINFHSNLRYPKIGSLEKRVRYPQHKENKEQVEPNGCEIVP